MNVPQVHLWLNRTVIMNKASQPPCIFCVPDEKRIFLREDSVIGLWDGFPVSPGHALLIPHRHVPNWFEATADEKMALVVAIDQATLIIDREYKPDGYNIGMNCGAAAGQTVFHLHVHLIPRYGGDVTDPRGGVRHVIPSKASYSGDGFS
jgi:diadenosine tetraphosphate (Ap4A) HIT family hydrolase